MMTPKKSFCRAVGPDVHMYIEGQLDALVTFDSAEFFHRKLGEAIAEAKRTAFEKNKLGMRGGTATFKITDPNGKTVYLD